MGKAGAGQAAIRQSCGVQSLYRADVLGVVYGHAAGPGVLRFDERIQRQRRGHRRSGDVQGCGLVDVDRTGASTAFCQSAGGRAGVLGIQPIPRPDRKFRRDADGRLQWRGNPAGAMRLVEIADDVVFTVELSVSAAQMAVY